MRVRKRNFTSRSASAERPGEKCVAGGVCTGSRGEEGGLGLWPVGRRLEPRFLGIRPCLYRLCSHRRPMSVPAWKGTGLHVQQL